VLALKNGLLVMAVAAVAALDVVVAGEVAAPFGCCEQAARAIVVAITIKRRRNIELPQVARPCLDALSRNIRLYPFPPGFSKPASHIADGDMTPAQAERISRSCHAEPISR
jgi:hypothetical protein